MVDLLRTKATVFLKDAQWSKRRGGESQENYIQPKEIYQYGDTKSKKKPKKFWSWKTQKLKLKNSLGGFKGWSEPGEESANLKIWQQKCRF